MKSRCLLVCLLGCGHAQKAAPPVGHAQAGAAIVSDASRAHSELSCAHCHASRQQAEQGQLSPGPPWPGTLERTTLKGQQGLDAATAADRCAATYQDRGLTAQQRADVVAFLRGQGGPPPGQPTIFDGSAPGKDQARRAAELDGDNLRGEKLFARACARCHRDGPGYRLSALLASSRVEVLMKVMLAPDNPRAGMPHYPAGRLTLQELADIAAYVSPQN